MRAVIFIALAGVTALLVNGPAVAQGAKIDKATKSGLLSREDEKKRDPIIPPEKTIVNPCNAANPPSWCRAKE